MNRIFLSFFLILFFAFTGKAQSSYTLQQCIDSALANNIPVKQSVLAAQMAEVNWRQSRSNLLPNLNAELNQGANFGRSIDPFTNTYVNQNVNTANYGISSGVVLFNGFSLQNLIRQTAALYEATKQESQQAKDNMTLSVILAYLQVLNNEDQVQQAFTQANSSQKALERLDILNGQGAVRPSDVSDLKGQLMADQLSIVDAKTQLESSKLSLLQLMNKPYDSTLRLERINVEEFLTSYKLAPDQVYQNSLGQFALIKAVAQRTRSAQYGVKAAKGTLFPQLSFGGGINTNYSSIAQNSGGKIPYGTQLKNNRFYYLGLGLNIPIFNANIARNRIRLANIVLKSSVLTEDLTKQQLHQQIDQAYLNMSNSYERYKVLLDQVNAYQESFRAAEVRFTSGVGTSIDYLNAKDRLDRANINLVNAKYDFVLRKRILDYYNGQSK